VTNRGAGELRVTQVHHRHPRFRWPVVPIPAPIMEFCCLRYLYTL